MKYALCCSAGRRDNRVRSRIWRRLGPLRVGIPLRVPPLDRVRRQGESGRGRTARIREHIARVIEDDVQDHVDPAGVRGVDQVAELLATQVRIGARGSRAGSEARLDLGEVLDPIAVVSLEVRAVLQHRRQPDRLRPQLLEVVKLRRHATQRAATVAARIRLIPRNAPAGGAAGLLKRSTRIM